MSKKRIWITIIGGCLTGGLAAAAGLFADNVGLLALLSAASGLVGAGVAYFGGE
jgi:hypothetical protein